MDVCLRVLKPKATKVGLKATVSGNSVLTGLYPILPFGIVACTFFPTTFLEIAVNKVITHSFIQDTQAFRVETRDKSSGDKFDSVSAEQECLKVC